MSANMPNACPRCGWKRPGRIDLHIMGDFEASPAAEVTVTCPNDGTAFPKSWGQPDFVIDENAAPSEVPS